MNHAKSNQLLHLLLQLDDSEELEWPSSFNYQVSAIKLKSFAKALQQAIGLSLKIETDSAIQDASFHSQILLPSINNSVINQALRFSNFGELAAVSEEELIDQKLLTTIIKLLPDYGYVYIPGSLHSQLYTGNQIAYSPIVTWWNRYFEWM